MPQIGDDIGSQVVTEYTKCVEVAFDFQRVVGEARRLVRIEEANLIQRVIPSEKLLHTFFSGLGVREKHMVSKS